ncbi:hypothetical protein GCM10007857_72590 [Bradyrhizobium iriomotense]|uniref:Uncharacterized protein n=1 Tax=Bradyrhizobium iriomotense TaxID=441950 RepID=A0ABQ6BAS9_9BRAD|nr:hypothetical protein GCM10007857_72590 [Bradyrhizobium iriomotense]
MRVAIQRRVGDRAGEGRQTDADAIGPPDIGNGGHDVDRETGSILNRAAVPIGVLVGAVADELLEQIVVRRMDLDASNPASLALPAAFL